jgi:hypothetical protein
MAALLLPTPFELNFGETVAAGTINAISTAFFTASFVAVAATLLVNRVEQRDKDRREREAAERSKALLQESHARAAEQQLFDQQHDERQQQSEHEFQTRKALREAYARLLIAQRQSRQASIALSATKDPERDEALIAARRAHDHFIDEYHNLALDADRPVWLELRALRHVLDDMLEDAEAGDAEGCNSRVQIARAARQNLERTLRQRLGHKALQSRKDLGQYDKTASGKGSASPLSYTEGQLR